MGTAIQSTQQLTNQQIDTLIKAAIIPPNTPPEQVQVFAHTCKELQLSPFTKEVYLLYMGGRFFPVVGIGGLRKIAGRTGQHMGTDDVKYDISADGSYKTAAEMMAAKQWPNTATVTVYRAVAGMKAAFTATVAFSEFNKKSGNWQAMPWQMIGKVAEAFALRKAFGDYGLSGVFIEEEEHAIEQVSKVADAEVEKMKTAALYALEQATTMTDEQEAAARMAIASATNTAELARIIERIRQFFPPSADPREQFKSRAK